MWEGDSMMTPYYSSSYLRYKAFGAGCLTCFLFLLTSVSWSDLRFSRFRLTKIKPALFLYYRKFAYYPIPISKISNMFLCLKTLIFVYLEKGYPAVFRWDFVCMYMHTYVCMFKHPYNFWLQCTYIMSYMYVCIRLI